jgi:hypothetical protein
MQTSTPDSTYNMSEPTIVVLGRRRIWGSSQVYTACLGLALAAPGVHSQEARKPCTTKLPSSAKRGPLVSDDRLYIRSIGGAITVQVLAVKLGGPQPSTCCRAGSRQNSSMLGGDKGPASPARPRYPMPSYSGKVASGITAPPIEEATMCAARADTEKSGTASSKKSCVVNCVPV